MTRNLNQRLKNQDLERTLNLPNPDHYLVLPAVLGTGRGAKRSLAVSPPVEGPLAPKYQCSTSTAPTSKRDFGWRMVGPLCPLLAKYNIKPRGPFCCKKKLQNSIQGTSTSFNGPNILTSITKTRTGRKDQQTLSKRGSEGNNSGIPRILLLNFSSSKNERKTKANLDLSTLNKYILIQGFRMETQKKVRNTIQPNDWAFSLDLMDAYLHVPIHPASRKYLRFTLKDKLLQCKALLFGLSTSPFVLTQFMTVIAVHLHSKAISLFPYLDDCLLLLQHRQFITQLITSLGLIINKENSLHLRTLCS